MVRKQLYIDDALNEGLRMLSARTGMSEAEHVRAALREYLRQDRGQPEETNPLLDLIGLVPHTDGPDDVAEHHDHYLYGVDRSA
jgi:hypothetical protein